MIFGHDLSFWLTMAGAVVVKLLTSPYHSIWRAAVQIVTAVFCAWVFTDPVIDWLDLDPDTYKNPVAALVAITGEGIVRALLLAANNPKEFIALLRYWRTGR